MSTPSEPLYRKIPEGYKKRPSSYTTCPSCGAIKSKASKTLCRSCQAVQRANGVAQPSDSSYRIIPLTKGLVAIVDAQDFDWLCHWSWSTSTDRTTGKHYAVRKLTVNGKSQRIAMHREIMGLKHGDERQVDHISIDETLNNRRSNLRVASLEENRRNRRAYKNNTTGFKGVSLHPSGSYLARIKYDGKSHNLGSFKTAEEAYAVYCASATEHHGEFSRLS